MITLMYSLLQVQGVYRVFLIHFWVNDYVTVFAAAGARRRATQP